MENDLYKYILAMVSSGGRYLSQDLGINYQQVADPLGRAKGWEIQQKSIPVLISLSTIAFNIMALGLAKITVQYKMNV